MVIISRGQITLTDMTDAIISGTAPINPTIGTLWIDKSVSNQPVLKEWNGSSWVKVAELDPNMYTVISNIQTTINNMSDDNLLDYSDRQIIKDKINDIIGWNITSATLSMPSVATLDSGASGKGTFFWCRKNAITSTLPTSDVKYVALTTAYNSLKTYLDSLTPIMAWNVATADQTKNITVVKDTFRQRFLDYYVAEQDLINATTDQIKKNLDNLEIGGTNYAMNGDFSQSLSSAIWSASYLSSANVGSYKQIVDISADSAPFKFAYNVKNTANANGGIFQPALFTGNSANALLGKKITISFWLKYSGITQGANAWNLGRFGELVIEGEKADTTKVYSYLRATSVNIYNPSSQTNSQEPQSGYISGTDTTWKKYIVTHDVEIPSSAVKITNISFKHGMESCTGEFWTTGIKIEFGTKSTDWIDSTTDINSRIKTVEQKITPDGIYSIVSSSDKYNATLDITSGDYRFENGIDNWRQTHALDSPVTGATLVSGVGLDGGNVVQFTGEKWLFYNRKIPINTSRTYKVRFRVRQTVDKTVGGSTVYAGVAMYNASKTPITPAQFGSHRYCAIAGKIITVADGWQIYEGTITGVGNDSYGQFVSGTVYVTPMLIVNYAGGNGVAQVDYCSIEDITDIESVATRVNNVEQAITDNGITTTIQSSTFYQNLVNDLNAKANSSDLSGLVSADDLSGAINDIDVEGKVNALANDKTSVIRGVFSTKLELEETSKNITNKFSATGGMNLLKNSVGYADFITKTEADKLINQNWFMQGVQSRIARVQTQGMDILGFGSGFQFSPSVAGQNSTIDQYVSVIPNQVYTLSWYINKVNTSPSSNNDGALDIFMYEYGTTTKLNLEFDVNGTNTNAVDRRYRSEYKTDGYEVGVVKFKPTTEMIHLRIYAWGLSDVSISGFMFSKGEMPLQWSLATGEMYNTNVRFDINGIRVSNLTNDGSGRLKEIGYTSIRPDEFAGYYDSEGDGTFEKIFYLNGDETVTKKLRATREITMGSIKIVKVPEIDGSASANKGWAFVPTE